MRPYDHDAFFASVRRSFGNLSQGQVNGFNAILAEAEKRGVDNAPLAYMLATAWHETGRAMQAVIETRGANEAVNPSVDEAIRRLEKAWASGKLTWVKTPYWRKDVSGKSWLGRGLVQLTHKANYDKMSAVCGVDLVADPSLALDLNIAVEIMFEGMIRGSFTGKKLADYIKATSVDYVAARRIINGTDKASTIAGYARSFSAALVPASAPAIPPIKPEPALAGPSPAPASVSSAAKDSKMADKTATITVKPNDHEIDFFQGVKDMFGGIASNMIFGANAIESPKIPTGTPDVGTDIGDLREAGKELLELVGDATRKDIHGGIDDAVDLLRVGFRFIARRGVRVPVVSDVIQKIDIDANG